MSDIRLCYNYNLSMVDYNIVNFDLETDSDLETAFFVSLFTWRAADPSWIGFGNDTYRRGWWGDQFRDWPIGSRLWLLLRAKKIPLTLQQANSYCLEALKWATDNKVVTNLTVNCEWDLVKLDTMNISIIVSKPQQASNTQQTYNFSWAWNQISDGLTIPPPFGSVPALPEPPPLGISVLGYDFILGASETD
jgi:phage gp46-like protein